MRIPMENENDINDTDQNPLLSTTEFETFEINENNQRIPRSIGFIKYILFFGLLSACLIFVFVYNKTFDSPLVDYNTSQLRVKNAKLGLLKYTSLLDDEQLLLFNEFKGNFTRQYKSNSDENARFQNFKKFLALVDNRNDIEKSTGGTAVHGITKFSDLTEDEFKSKYLGYKKTPADKRLKYKRLGESNYTRSVPKHSSGTVNWADVLTTSVKDQGYCGSCWAFSSVSQIESDAIRAGYLTTSDNLSVQQVVSCDAFSLGCEGGSTESAYYYVYETGGLLKAEEYPYSSYYDESGNCLSSSEKFSITIDDYFILDTETAMKAHIMTTGPLSVCVDAQSWSSYTGGILSSCGKEADHCVQVVGINTLERYWIVRNSWGTTWGDNGFIYLKYGSNTCDITNDPTYVEVVKTN